MKTHHSSTNLKVTNGYRSVTQCCMDYVLTMLFTQKKTQNFIVSSAWPN